MEKFAKTALPLKGAFLFETFEAHDERGIFSKLADSPFLSSIGFETKEVFYSVNKKNVLRGLHYLKPSPQARLVFCTQGRVWDAIADIRRNSPTFGKWHGCELSAKNKLALYVPRGFAHGFLSLEDNATVFYLADEAHKQEHDFGIRFDDPALAIKWPTGGAKPIVSVRDLSFPLLKDANIYE